MNPTAEDILNKQIADNNDRAHEVCQVYFSKPDRIVIIAAMEEYSILKSKEAASEAFDAGEKYGGMKEHHDLDDHFPDKETYMKKYDTTEL